MLLSDFVIPQSEPNSKSAINGAMSVLTQNALVLMTLLGFAGGLAGAIVSEVLQESGVSINYEEGTYSFGRFFPHNIHLATGVWFMLAVVCIGAAMSVSQGLLEKNVEKSKFAALRTIPAAVVGGFLAGVIAQSVYSALIDVGINEIPRSIGWGVAGGLAGLAIGAGFGSLVRLRNGGIGGFIGGFAGGLAFNTIGNIVGGVASRLIGITLIGTLIGLAIGILDYLTTNAYLEVVTAEGVAMRYPLIGKTHIIGCASSVSVAILRDPGVREQHVRLEVAGGRVNFTCLPNMPQVSVNGQPTSQGSLGNGDILLVGNTSLRLNTKKSLSFTGSSAPRQPVQPQAGTPQQSGPWRPTVPVNNVPQAPSNAPTSQPSAPAAPAPPAQRPTIQMKPPQN